MDGTQIVLPLSRGSPPIPRTSGDREEHLLTLADALAEQEGVPIEEAYRIASRHFTTRLEATHENGRNWYAVPQGLTPAAS